MVKKPQNEAELMARARSLAGLSLNDICLKYNYKVHENLKYKKGWIGELFEKILGCDAGNKALPDFTELGIELKTLPINEQLKVIESTYICTAPYHQAKTWEQSVLYKKTRRILWLPILLKEKQAIGNRVLCNPILWQCDKKNNDIFKQDWLEHTEHLCLGNLDKISARVGSAIQLRPKASNSKKNNLIRCLDDNLYEQKIIPKGYYFKSSFTNNMLQDCYFV